MCIKFDKIDGSVTVLTELDISYYLEVENMIPFTTGLDICTSVKSGITYIIFYSYAKAKVDSCDSLPLEKKQWLLTMLNTYLISL